MSKNYWNNNYIQFARLLSEIRAVGFLSKDPALSADLCSSMDLKPERVDEIFDRAEKAWEAIKNKVANPDEDLEEDDYDIHCGQRWSD